MDTSHENRERVSHAHLPRVVIVGGGFGGLYAARGLARAPVTVTVVDKHNYHLFRPMLYQVAIQGGTYVASLIRRRVNGERSPKPFWYWDKGNMAIAGRTLAVADLKHVCFSGFTAWLLWAGIHIYFLIGFANRLLVMLQRGISFVTKRRGVRILPLAQAEMTHANPGRQTVSPPTSDEE